MPSTAISMTREKCIFSIYCTTDLTLAATPVTGFIPHQRRLFCHLKDRFEDFLNCLVENGDSKLPCTCRGEDDSKDRIFPIEINPLRFGGWCTTADLLGVAIGYNAYEYYLEMGNQTGT